MKQRLLGAAVLIALAVVFVPMFFPGAPPKPESDNVSLEIPAEPGSELKSQVFQLDVPAQSDAQSAQSAPTAAASAPVPVPTQAQAPAVSQSAPVPETAAAPAEAENKPATPVGTAAATRFAISLGVFANTGNADSRLAKAKLLGYPAYMETVQISGKPAHAVRVGPFDGRAAAEAARLRLKAEMPGDKPSLVALGGSSSKDAPASAVADNAAGGWAVQLAASRSRDDAMRLRDTVRKAGFEAFVDDTRDSEGTWWRVRVGPRTQRADAEALKKAIKRKLGRDGLVVAHP
ncbi:MAG: SPOR domain-containing protein [Rhodanobacteraceae bacterium]